MYQIKLSLNTGVYDGVSFLEEAADDHKLQEFIDGIVVAHIEHQEHNYHCTCISPMYSGPLFYVNVPSLPLDMNGIRTSDIEQLSTYVKEYVRQNNNTEIVNTSLIDINDI